MPMPADQPALGPGRGIAIFGVTGRMGQSLLQGIRESKDFHLAGAIASAESSRLGKDAAAAGEPTGVIITADVRQGLGRASVALDFSLGDAVVTHAESCAGAAIPILIGATGFDDTAAQALQLIAQKIPLLLAPNTSVGVGVLGKLVAVAAAGLGPEYDVEITDTHHRMKRDAPSGTALALGTVVAEARGRTLPDIAVYDRHGRHEPREQGSIGFSAIRAGDIVGEHTVTFATAGERIEITHRATDRMTFARGALRAAAWLADKPAGLYHMQDVLGLI